MSAISHKNPPKPCAIVIFGANGDGNLMLADDAVNITEEVKGYVNERFKGQP